MLLEELFLEFKNLSKEILTDEVIVDGVSIGTVIECDFISQSLSVSIDEIDVLEENFWTEIALEKMSDYDIENLDEIASLMYNTERFNEFSEKFGSFLDRVDRELKDKAEIFYEVATYSSSYDAFLEDFHDAIVKQ